MCFLKIESENLPIRFLESRVISAAATCSQRWPKSTRYLPFDPKIRSIWLAFLQGAVSDTMSICVFTQVSMHCAIHHLIVNICDGTDGSHKARLIALGLKARSVLSLSRRISSFSNCPSTQCFSTPWTLQPLWIFYNSNVKDECGAKNMRKPNVGRVRFS